MINTNSQTKEKRMSNELKLSVYDPLVKAYREVTVEEKEAKEYLKSLKKAEKGVKEHFKVEDEK
jgi:hypothetical protein